MRRVLAVALIAVASTSSAAAFSEMQPLVRYDCAAASCNLKCTGPDTSLALTYKSVTVFQWTLHGRRLWIATGDAHHVLGDDVTCKFEGNATFKFGSSPLPPVKPPCTCIGGQCNPPGCRP